MITSSVAWREGIAQLVTPHGASFGCRTRAACRCSAESSKSSSTHIPSRSSFVRNGLRAGVLGSLATQLTSVAAIAEPEKRRLEPDADQVAMRTLAGSELAIGFYPKFVYNSSGGGGVAQAAKSGSNRINLLFDPTKVSIPDVTGYSTTFLGAPMLPFLKIAIEPTRLEGHLDADSGEVELFFDASFRFTAGPIYAAPPLLVKTRLTTEHVSSRHHSRTGERLDRSGFATLTGVADIAPTGDPLMDNFLQLPTDVLAVMRSQFALGPSLA